MHGAVRQFPGATKRLPLIRVAASERITVWQATRGTAKVGTQAKARKSKRARRAAIPRDPAANDWRDIQRVVLQSQCCDPGLQSIDVHSRTSGVLRFSRVTSFGSSFVIAGTGVPLKFGVNQSHRLFSHLAGILQNDRIEGVSLKADTFRIKSDHLYGPLFILPSMAAMAPFADVHMSATIASRFGLACRVSSATCCSWG